MFCLRVLARRLRQADAQLGDATFLTLPARLAKTLVDLGRTYGEETRDGSVRVSLRLTQTELARDRFIIGDATFVKEEIARYREALGIDHFMMRCHWPGLDFEKALGSIKRLGEIFA